MPYNSKPTAAAPFRRGCCEAAVIKPHNMNILNIFKRKPNATPSFRESDPAYRLATAIIGECKKLYDGPGHPNSRRIIVVDLDKLFEFKSILNELSCIAIETRLFMSRLHESDEKYKYYWQRNMCYWFEIHFKFVDFPPEHQTGYSIKVLTGG